MKKLSYALAVLMLSASPLLAGVQTQPPVTTVPEPATMALLAGGAAILGVVAWRRKGR